jgi:two-component system chemotaxis sensor kinase CheA
MAIDPLLVGLIRGFAVEATDLCRSTTVGLLILERADAEVAARRTAAETVGRGLHTLKGSAATVGMADVAELAHALETQLAGAAAPGERLPTAVADALLEGLDQLLARVQTHATGLGASPDAQPTTVATPGSPAPPEPRPAPQGDGEQTSWRIGASQVARLVRQVEPLREAVLRADERRDGLDALLALPAAFAPAHLPALEALRGALAADAAELSGALYNLDKSVEALSTLPVSGLQDALDRAVRDAARRTAKQARLSLVGGELGLDRGMLDALRGPLLHLVRNAVDHGLEPPAVREQRGKDRTGELVVRFESHGNQVVIEVSDDGGGLDLNAVRARAVQRGLLAPETSATLDDERLTALIFLPGFSTRDAVSEVSGRGVGLDVVKREVEALDGHVEVSTRAGQGTQFLLFLPVDAGSLPVLLVKAGGQRFAVPMVRLEAATRAGAAGADLPSGRPTLALRGADLEVDDLAALLGLREAQRPAPGQPVLVVRTRSGRRAVVVDALLGDESLSVRPMPRELRAVPAFQGACTLARGELVLLLRPDWLETATAAQPPPRRHRRVLVVDDSLTARALHRVLLEAGGFTVDALADASEALERLRHASYDLVVADVGLPGMDGMAMTREIRAAPQTAAVRVVLVSARAGSDWLTQGLAAGADAVLTKQACASGALLAEVQRVLAGARS